MNLLSALVLVSSSAASAAPVVPSKTGPRSYEFELQSWKSDCRPSLPSDSQFHCALQVKDFEPLKLEVRVEEPRLPQEARSASRNFRATGDGGELRGRIQIFRVHPPAGAKTPRYLQLRLEILSPVRVVCLESVIDGEAALLPTLHCAGFAGGSTEQRGLNLLSRSVEDVGLGPATSR